jgi:spoIIIJ-associated protein
MDTLDHAQETLDAMLGSLGFAATVSADRATSTLHVTSGDGPLLIGENGERLEEIQHLLNRIVLDHDKTAPHVHVDIENYRPTRDHRLIEGADEIASRVIATGRTVKLEPINSYQRRLIHHHFKDHPAIASWSPGDEARIKRISLSPR